MINHAYMRQPMRCPYFLAQGAQSEEGCGNVYNLPLRARMGGQDVLDAWRRLLSQLEAKAPELIIISAGLMPMLMTLLPLSKCKPLIFMN